MAKTDRIGLLLIDFINPLTLKRTNKLAPWALKAAGNTRRLKAACVACGVPCIYINDNFGDWRGNFTDLVDRAAAQTGPGGVIAQMLRPEPTDYAMLKPRHSAFYGTPLAFLLEELRISKLILTGLEADVCVFFTAQDAYVRKFQLWVPPNCVGTENDAHFKGVLALMRRNLKANTKPAGRSIDPAREFQSP